MHCSRRAVFTAMALGTDGVISPGKRIRAPLGDVMPLLTRGLELGRS